MLYCQQVLPTSSNYDKIVRGHWIFLDANKMNIHIVDIRYCPFIVLSFNSLLFKYF